MCQAPIDTDTVSSQPPKDQTQANLHHFTSEPKFWDYHLQTFKGSNDLVYTTAAQELGISETPKAWAILDFSLFLKRVLAYIYDVLLSVNINKLRGKYLRGNRL